MEELNAVRCVVYDCAIPPELAVHIASPRVFECPRAFLLELPEAQVEPPEVWSAFARVQREGLSWSETGLRRRVNAEMSRAQLPVAQRGQEARPSADDPGALMRQYIKTLEGSVL